MSTSNWDTIGTLCAPNTCQHRIGSPHLPMKIYQRACIKACCGLSTYIRNCGDVFGEAEKRPAQPALRNGTDLAPSYEYSVPSHLRYLNSKGSGRHRPHLAVRDKALGRLGSDDGRLRHRTEVAVDVAGIEAGLLQSALQRLDRLGVSRAAAAADPYSCNALLESKDAENDLGDVRRRIARHLRPGQLAAKRIAAVMIGDGVDT